MTDFFFIPIGKKKGKQFLRRGGALRCEGKWGPLNTTKVSCSKQEERLSKKKKLSKMVTHVYSRLELELHHRKK